MQHKSLIATSILLPMLLLAGSADIAPPSVSVQDVSVQTEIEKEPTANPEETTCVAEGEEVSCGFWHQSPALYHSVATHCIAAVSFWGDSLEIEDGSVWKVHPSYNNKVLGWLTTDPLVITQNTSWFSRFAYQLVNQNTGEYAEVNLSFGPIINGPYTRYIVAIDLSRKELMLNDNTHWAVSWFDTSLFSKWALGNAIIIGVNSGFDSKCESLLINVTTNDNLRARQF